MTKSITSKTLPIAAIATAIFALTAETSFAADNKTLSWEFGDGQAHGWQIVSGEVGFYDGGMASATYETRDAEQATFLARSPMFRLNGGGGLKITLKGGMGKRLPATARQVLAKPRTSNGGPMGVALRRVTDDAYVLFFEKSKTHEQTITVAKEQLDKLIERSHDEVYTLDLVDGLHGGWGHLPLVRASVSATPVDPLPKPPAGFGAPARHLFLGSKHGKLEFDKKELWATPGSKVSLTLFNSDEMAHNFILCQPGDKVANELGEYVIGNLAETIKTAYVPPDPRVIAHTDLVAPGTSDTIYITVPNTPGDYPYVCTFPGHYQLMRGVLHVTAKLPEPKVDVLKPPMPGDAFRVTVTDRPIIVRGPLHGSGPASICVGTLSGAQFAFDSARCIVAKTWMSPGGELVNTKPAWDGRGGNFLQIMGQGRFSAGKDAKPLDVGSGDVVPDFRGYEIGDDGYPSFHYKLGDITVRVRVVPAGDGLDANFTLKPAPADATYTLGETQSIGEAAEQGTAVKVGANFTVHFNTK